MKYTLAWNAVGRKIFQKCNFNPYPADIFCPEKLSADVICIYWSIFKCTPKVAG